MTFDRTLQFQPNPDRPERPLPHMCRCGVRWAGSLAAHCATCHETFSGASNFDRHRRGGQCLPPASVGMVPIEGRRFEAWGFPVA